jgi:hypothetical protein
MPLAGRGIHTERSAMISYKGYFIHCWHFHVQFMGATHIRNSKAVAPEAESVLCAPPRDCTLAPKAQLLGQRW